MNPVLLGYDIFYLAKLLQRKLVNQIHIVIAIAALPLAPAGKVMRAGSLLLWVHAHFSSHLWACGHMPQTRPKLPHAARVRRLGRTGLR